MKPFNRVPLRHACAGMVVSVKGQMNRATIKAVELFVLDGGVTDRLYRLAANPELWDFLELGLKRNGKVAEVRLMRQITDAPSFDEGAIPNEIHYAGITFMNPERGGGHGYIMDRSNRFKVLGKSRWTTYTARLDGVTLLLTIASWEGGSGAYFGRLVPKKDATAHMVALRTRTTKK